ncbi:MAG: adenine nucleotide alpha hydrolase [Betaproteobacteria bacterium]|nr:adenine nucleotide alpha hydrolase [Betaproteobacteria bacterium]
MSKCVLLSWSSGKDSAWTLHVLRQQPDTQIVGLLTAFAEAGGRVAVHEVRRELVTAQSAAAGLPLWDVALPSPCPNDEYERRMADVFAKAKSCGITHVAFGDLFLSDIREYRVRLLAGSGLDPLFPIWSAPERTSALARQMLAVGLGAVLTCVDTSQLDARFAGRRFDEALLDELPSGVDRCGENGEFHTFCYEGPMFAHAVPVQTGEVRRDGRFCHADVLPER